MRKKLLLIYNPVSGKGGIIKELAKVIKIFTEAGYDVTVHPTTEKGDGEDYIGRFAGEYDLVCACGGDGMLHELFNGMKPHGADVKCGFIPTGTVNDFAGSIKMPKKIAKAAKLIVKQNFAPVDAGCFNGTRFAYIAAFGFFTEVSYSTSSSMKKKFGSFAYILTGFRVFGPRYFKNKSANLKITCGDEVYEGEFAFGMAGNTLSIAGIKNAIPKDSTLDDGLLDFIFVKPPKSLKDIKRIKGAVSGKKPCDNLLRLRADKVTIECDRPVDWDLDGEYGGKSDYAEISAEKHALFMALPPIEEI